MILEKFLYCKRPMIYYVGVTVLLSGEYGTYRLIGSGTKRRLKNVSYFGIHYSVVSMFNIL